MTDPRVQFLEDRIRTLRRRLDHLPQRSSERARLEAQVADLLDDLDLARRQRPLFDGPEAA